MVRAWVRLGLRSAETVLRHGAEAAREVLDAIDKADLLDGAVVELQKEFGQEKLVVSPDAPPEDNTPDEESAPIGPAATPTAETLAMLEPPPAPKPVHTEGEVQVRGR